MPITRRQVFSIITHSSISQLKKSLVKLFEL